MKYAEYLIDNRRVGQSEGHILAAKALGDLVQVTNQHWFPLQKWEELYGHERHGVVIVGVGRELRGGVIVGRSSALLHGLALLSVPSPRVEVCLPNNTMRPRKEWPRGVIYQRGLIPPELIVEVEGVKTTTAARAAVDVARYWGCEQGLAAMDSFLHQGGKKSQLREEMLRLGRVRGIGEVRRAVGLADKLPESPYESYFRVLLLRVPEARNYRMQAWVGRYRVDFLLPRGVVVEIDGDVKYQERAGQVIRAERDRERELLNSGKRVIRFTPTELLKNPDGCVEIVRRSLREAGAVA